MADVKFQFDSYTFGAGEGEDVHIALDEAPMRLTTAEVAKRHGVVVGDFPVADARTITLRGMMVGTGHENLRDKWDTMNLALKGERGKLRFHDDRYINAYCETLERLWIPGSELRVIKFVAVFLCDDPFFYPDTGLVETGPTKRTHKALWTVNNTGDVPVYPYITLENVSASGWPTLKNATLASATGLPQVMQFKDTKPSNNDPIEFDGPNFDLYETVSSVRRKRNDLFAGNYWVLNPGNNVLRIEFSGGGQADVSVDFTPRYW